MSSNRKIGRRLAPVAAFAMLVVALVAVNVTMAFVRVRADITEEGLYTLSKGTREILAGIEDPITLKLYFSQNVPDVPVAFSSYSTKVVELLREYKAAAPGAKLHLEIHDPAPDTDDEEWATRYGLGPARLPNGNNLYFGLVAVAADREAIVAFFDPRREKFLEYDITEAISRVQQVSQPKMGVLSYLPMGGIGPNPMLGPQAPQNSWAIVSELKKTFDVRMLQADALIEVPQDLVLLMVVHPRVVPARISYALDQFVLRGGKMIVLVDPNSRMDVSGGGQFGSPTNSTLAALFEAWGVEFDAMHVVGDLELATRVNTPQQGVIDYPIWITLRPQYLNHEQVITGELDEMTFIDAGMFKPREGMKVTYTPLITSSPNSGLVDFASVRLVDPGSMGKMVKVDGETKTLAVLLSGRFPSAYPDGPPKPPLEPPSKDVADQLAARAGKHLAEASAETSVVLVGDADFVADQFSVQQANFFGTVVTQPINDNLNLVLNAAEFLAGSQSLIHIRSRGKFSRPFTRVADLQVSAAKQFAEEEQRLSDKLESVKGKLQEIERQRPKGENLMLSPAQMEAVREFRLEEQNTRRALREVRKVLRQDIEVLGNTLLAINLLVVPLLVAGVGFFVIVRRSRRSGGKP